MCGVLRAYRKQSAEDLLTGVAHVICQEGRDVSYTRGRGARLLDVQCRYYIQAEKQLWHFAEDSEAGLYISRSLYIRIQQSCLRLIFLQSMTHFTFCLA